MRIVFLKNISLVCGCAKKLVKLALFNVIYFVQDRQLNMRIFKVYAEVVITPFDVVTTFFFSQI